MKFVLDNTAFFSFVISLITIGITIYKFYLERPKLKFYDSHVQHFFKYTDPSEYHYKDSVCIAFVYLKIANPSNFSCTISEFKLHIEGYEDTFFRCGTKIRDEYIISGYYHAGKYSSVRGIDFIRLPALIPPFGYIEGYVVFPYAPKYEAKDLYMEVVAKTPKKDFSFFDTIHFGFSDT